MSIDWLTVTAQLLNFLILVFLLRRFLYRPVLNVMAKRESVITGRLQRAEDQEAAARQRQQQYQSLIDDLAQQKDSLLQSAQQEAEQERQSLAEQARQEIAGQKALWLAELNSEKQRLISGLRQQCGLSVLRAARRAVSDLADTHLEQQLINVFCARLASLTAAERDVFHTALSPVSEADDSDQTVVTSSFELDDAQRQQLSHALGSVIGATRVQFRVDPVMPFGIALMKNGERISWSIDEYFDQLEQQIAAALETR